MIGDGQAEVTCNYCGGSTASHATSLWCCGSKASPSPKLMPAAASTFLPHRGRSGGGAGGRPGRGGAGSTLLAHGLPWPQNLEVGIQAETAVRQAGAIPQRWPYSAGACVSGFRAVSLSGWARGPLSKAAAADLGPLLASGGDGATTVSATVVAAARSGVRLFATGGIGGVHRGDALDVSSDLTALSHHPVAVVRPGPRQSSICRKRWVSGDARGAGGRLPHRRFPRVLYALYRPAARPLGGLAAGGGAVCGASAGSSDARLATCKPIPSADALDAELVERAIDAARRAAAARGDGRSS